MLEVAANPKVGPELRPEAEGRPRVERNLRAEKRRQLEGRKALLPRRPRPVEKRKLRNGSEIEGRRCLCRDHRNWIPKVGSE